MPSLSTASLRRSLQLVAAAATLAAPLPAHAGTASVADSTEGRGDTPVQYLSYAGGAEQNRVTVQLTFTPGSGFAIATLVDLAGAAPGRGCARAPGSLTTVRCRLGNGTSIFVASTAVSMTLGAGNDTAAMVGGAPTNASLSGESGNDVLNAGTGAGDSEDPGLATGSYLNGGPGNDTLLGGPGDDFIDESGGAANGTDTLRAGNGDDTVSYRGRRLSVRADLANDRDDGESGELDLIENAENLIGGTRADRLTGDNRSNDLAGRGGSDVISGRGGDDEVHAGGEDEFAPVSARTRDRLSGGSGDDFLTGSRGANRLRPGPGRDDVLAGGGSDRVFARDGSTDDITCGRGRDRVRLDGADAIGGGCERIARRGQPRGVIVGDLGFFGPVDNPFVSAPAACPFDFGPVCRTRLTLLKNGRLIGAGRDRVRRRSDVEQTVSARLNARGRRLVRSLDGGSTTIRARLTTLLPGGGFRRITTTETITDDL